MKIMRLDNWRIAVVIFLVIGSSLRGLSSSLVVFAGRSVLMLFFMKSDALLAWESLVGL